VTEHLVRSRADVSSCLPLIRLRGLASSCDCPSHLPPQVLGLQKLTRNSKVRRGISTLDEGSQVQLD
jgi:hypothetical protein